MHVNISLKYITQLCLPNCRFFYRLINCLQCITESSDVLRGGLYKYKSITTNVSLVLTMQRSDEYLFVFKVKVTVLRKCNVMFYSSAHVLLFISHQMREALPLVLAVLHFCATPLNTVPTPDLTAEENSEFCSHLYSGA